MYEFSLPFGLYIETCTSFYAFSGPKWPSSRVGILDTYQNTVSFVRFPSLDATASTPLASTHCQLAVLVAVCWRNLPSVASTGLIFIRSENETFVTTASRCHSHRPTQFLFVCCCADNASVFTRPPWVKPHCRPRYERLRGMKSRRYDPANDSLSPLESPMFHWRWESDSCLARHSLAKKKSKHFSGTKKLSKLVHTYFILGSVW
jgi:hypothetical protein